MRGVVHRLPPLPAPRPEFVLGCRHGRHDSVRLAGSYRDQGLTHNELRQLVKGGALARVRHGAYARQLAEDFEARHRQLIAATLPRLGPDTYLSHASAALLYGWPSWADQLERVHVTKPRSAGGRRGRLVHVHTAALTSTDRAELGGHPATGRPRTVVDCARTWDFSRAVGLADAALRAGLAREDFMAQVDLVPGRRGAAQARRITAFADGRAESVGESFSRVVVAELNVSAPDLQVEVFDDLGRLVARSDFGWVEQRTLGDFDGRIKYGRLLRPGQTPGEAIVAEKRREDMLRDLGWEIVRWMWEDLKHPELIEARLRRAFARAAKRR